MAFESTITEADLDGQSQIQIQGLNLDEFDREPDLAVEGMSDSILSRLVGLFSRGG